MQTFLYFLAVIGPLIFIHELGHFLVAKWRGVRVERFSLGYPPRLFGFKRGDTDYCVSAVPLGGYVKMAGENPEEPHAGAPDEFGSKSASSRAMIIAAGPLANYVLAFFLYSLTIWIGGDLVAVDNGLRVGSLREDMPAAAAGLAEGDLMLALDGVPLTAFQDLRDYVGPRPETPIEMTVERDGDTLKLELVPVLTSDPQTGEDMGMIGLSPAAAYQSIGFFASISRGADATWQNTKMVAGFFGRFVSGRESMSNLGGPLFIASVAGQVAEQGWRVLLSFMAILSINLMILNLLPIPVLDGGQLAFILIEKLKGTPLSITQRIRVQQVGLAFLFMVIILVTINDIVRVFS
jgi:regulator of sigma E protease